ncbi:diacylglycerol/lipid kinase family protein [Aspergillus tanneri]|uniref:DAGKc domain-containing protein n=1 Tax=Aspergillus tanneri TaxID=1220188 RepID=A0A5M9MV14_9EURO|nr:uncharacterized protein ATNIH1004_005129 [Aspergillus tanneri]KAA8649234.1 hypothetical protein ATNIH1004_005129 [Aspergillus tanneri]
MLFLRGGHKNAKCGPEDVHAHLESIQLVSLPSTVLTSYLCPNIPHWLKPCSGESMNVHVIISTLSGTGMAKNFYQYILQPFLVQIGLVDYKVHETKSAQTIIRLCKSQFIPVAQSGVPQLLILLSGDGGLSDIVDTFHSATAALLAPPTIALIPAGTGNAMASSMQLNSHISSGLVTLLRGRPKLVPTFIAAFSPGAQHITEEGHSRTSILGNSRQEGDCPKIRGAVVVSWGMHAALVADSDTTEYRRFGSDRFKMAANELLFPSNGTETHKYAGTITLTKWDRQTDSRYMETVSNKEHMYVLATLLPRLEKDFMISPKSKPLDGSLWFVHFGPMPPEQAMQLMTHAYCGGQHVGEEGVFYSEIEGFKIEFNEIDERWRRVCIDGKIVVVENGGWMEVRKEVKHAVNILAPPGIDDIRH